MDSSDYNKAPEACTIAKKRNRKPVSCAPCRQRKLRCDQALPVCGSCVRRGDMMSCSYQYRRGGIQRYWPSSHGNSRGVQSRIDRLEQLVLNMINQKEAPELDTITNQAVPDRDTRASSYEGPKENVLPITDPIISRVSRTNADYGSSYTTGETHWAALLNEINEVRSYLQTQQKQYEDQSKKISQLSKRTPDDPGPTLLFGACQSLSHGEILAQIPSRYTCDMFLERYFRALDPALHILHPPTFQRQVCTLLNISLLSSPEELYLRLVKYVEHWEKIDRTPVMWIGLLFAMMRIAALSWQRDGDEPLQYHGKSQDLSRSYRTRVADCILLADYTKPQEFLIETLTLHLYGEYASHQDADSSSWVLLGTIIRLAMRMGYHREPDHLTSVTPFQAEMRRRVWTFIRQADIFFSFQHGFPSMIDIGPVDKGLPRNIYDTDFGPTSNELPAPLPNSEATPIAYLICKARLALAMGRALKELNHQEVPPPYERVLEIDRSIQAIYAKVPNEFRLRSMAEQQQDPISMISARFTLANIYHKVLCVVHSRFLKAARIDARFCISRRVCLESAMALLRLQAIQHQEVRVSGQVRSLARYMTSLNTHNYLLAVTIICTELFLDHGRDPFPFSTTGPTRNEMVESLEWSTIIWSQMREESIEAYKASDVLGMLLKKLRHPNDNRERAFSQQGLNYPTPACTTLSEIGAIPNLTPMYPDPTLNDRTRTLHPPQKDIARYRSPMGCGSAGVSFGNGVPSTTTDTIMTTHIAVTAPSAPVFSRLNSSKERDFECQDPSTMWEHFAVPLDLSDPLSSLWALDTSRRET